MPTIESCDTDEVRKAICFPVFPLLDSLGATSGNNLAGFTITGGSAPPQLRNPSAVFVALSGAMFIADTLNYRVQKWLPNEPLGTTVAGGRGNGATLDRIGLVYGIFVDGQESIYVSENSNHRVTLWYAWNTTAGELVSVIFGSAAVSMCTVLFSIANGIGGWQ